MSPAFRNVVRFSAVAGMVLLFVAFAGKKMYYPSPALKQLNSMGTVVSPGIGSEVKALDNNEVVPGARSPLGVHTAGVQADEAGERAPSPGDQGGKSPAGNPDVPGEQRVVAREGNQEKPTNVSPDQPPTGDAVVENPASPPEGAPHRSRDRNSFTPLPDLVLHGLDDASAPRFREKSSHPDESAQLAKEFLIPGMVPGIIHYLWCGNRWFGFKQYLALVSAVKAIKPDKIVFHYEFEPQGDRVFYHQWWQDVLHDYPFLYVHAIAEKEMDACHGPVDARIKRLLSWMDYEGGGVYVSENTWLTDFSPQLRVMDFDYALDPDTLNGYIILRSGIARSHDYSVKSMLADKSLSTRHSVCVPVHEVHHQKGAPPATKCVSVTGAKVYDFLTPMHVWELDTPFGRLTRKLYYGTEEILTPKPSYDELVPNIGHMIWIGGGRMDFLFYLSLLSKLFVLKVDVVYIHGDVPPAGEYWQKLQQNKRISDRVKFISRPPPYRIYQGVIEPYYRALMSDLIRVDIMIKYGGVYTDTDAIWTKPLSREERGYDAVASFDWVDWSYPYPDSVNFGLSYGKRNAPFWRIFRESMRTLHNDVHGFTGVMMPYKLLEKYPHLLRIDKRLMAICYQQRCHPTYVADYHNETNNHVTTNSIANWREDLHSLHWTHPNPPEYANETTLMAATGMFADVGRFVLKSAGLI